MSETNNQNQSTSGEIKDVAQDALNVAGSARKGKRIAEDVMNGEGMAGKIADIIQKGLSNQTATSAMATGSGATMGGAAGSSVAGGAAGGGTAAAGTTASTATAGTAATAAGGAAGGAAAGSVVPVAGTIIGAIVGLAAAAAKNASKDENSGTMMFIIILISASLLSAGAFLFLGCGTILTKGIAGMIAQHQEAEFAEDEDNEYNVAQSSKNYEEDSYPILGEGEEKYEYEYKLPLHHALSLFIYGPPNAVNGENKEDPINQEEKEKIKEEQDGTTFNEEEIENLLDQLKDADLENLDNEALKEALKNSGLGLSQDQIASLTAAYTALMKEFGNPTLAIGIMANIVHEGVIGQAQKGSQNGAFSGKILNNLTALQQYKNLYGAQSGHAFGMIQWDADRQSKLLDIYIKAAEKAPGGELTSAQMAAIETQFMINELKGTEKRAYNAAIKAKSPREAAVIIMQQYERCSENKTQKKIKQRGDTGPSIEKVLRDIIK